MKNFVFTLIVFAFILPMNSALASKSRLEALGQSSLGSFYISDQRSVFLNPAHVALIDEQIVMEWGSGGTTADSVTDPKQEGGLFKKGRFAYGFYLGQEDANVFALRNSADANLLKVDNTVDIFVGKGSDFSSSEGLAWGGNLTFSSNQDERTGIKRTESFVRLKGGVVYGKSIEGFAHLYLKDDAEGSTTGFEEYKGNIGVTLGGSFRFLEELKAYGHFTTKDADYKVTSGATNQEASIQAILLGVARIVNLEGDNFYFYAVELDNTKTTVAGRETTETSLPIVLGVEAKVKDWLVLRGSVRQNVFINEEKVEVTGGGDTTSTQKDTTSVAGGLSFYLEKFRFDGSFSTAGATLNAGNIMSRVALTYTF